MCQVLRVTQARKDFLQSKSLHIHSYFVFATVPHQLFVPQGLGNQKLENIHMPSCVQNLKHKKFGELFIYTKLYQNHPQTWVSLSQKEI